MGGGGVGKSAVTVRFINGEYVEMYDPTSTYSDHVELISSRGLLYVPAHLSVLTQIGKCSKWTGMLA